MSEEHSTAYKLTMYQFNYSIPGIHFYSQEYLDTVGILSTGDKKMDVELMKTRIDTRGSVLAIALHHAADHSVMIQNPQDAVQMYEIANQHLLNWKNALARESNLPDVPIEDLEALEEFATSIYQIARRYKPEIREKVSIATRMRGLGGSSAVGLRKGISTGRPATKVERFDSTKPLPEHHPVIDSIKEYYSTSGPKP